MVNRNEREDDVEKHQQVVITLALIQKALIDLTERVDMHQKLLLGNGNPENSVVWAIKLISQTIDKLDKQLENNSKTFLTVTDSIQKELGTLRDNDANLSWKQWFKKITIKWLPILVILLVIIIPFHEQIGQFLCILLKLLG
jgi:hypothetical protein